MFNGIRVAYRSLTSKLQQQRRNAARKFGRTALHAVDRFFVSIGGKSAKITSDRDKLWFRVDTSERLRPFSNHSIRICASPQLYKLGDVIAPSAARSLASDARALGLSSGAVRQFLLTDTPDDFQCSYRVNDAVVATDSHHICKRVAEMLKDHSVTVESTCIVAAGAGLLQTIARLPLVHEAPPARSSTFDAVLIALLSDDFTDKCGPRLCFPHLHLAVRGIPGAALLWNRCTDDGPTVDRLQFRIVDEYTEPPLVLVATVRSSTAFVIS